MPLIGDALGDAVRFVDQFVGPLADQLAGGAEPGELIASAGQRILFETLGPGPNGNGLNLLRDANGDGQITADDVGIAVDADNELAFEILLGQTGINTSAGLDLGVGGSALGLDLVGDANLTAGYSIGMIVGFHLQQGPFVEFAGGNDIRFDFHASIDDLAGQARLGPLSVLVETIDAADLTVDQRQRTRLDPLDATTEAINAIRGELGVDFPAGRYTLANLGTAFSGVSVEAGFVGSLHTRVAVW